MVLNTSPLLHHIRRLTAAKEDLNNITMVPVMRGNPYITHLQDVIKAVRVRVWFHFCNFFLQFSKTLPLVVQDSSIGQIERGADGLIHDVFHPIETFEHGIQGASWDVRHITSYRSSFILLRGLVIVFLLYIICGMIIMVKYHNAQGIERLPHLSFWMSYPGLVTDGVFYVRDMVGLHGGGGSYDRLSNSSNVKFPDASRDTFSQFEPI